MKKKKKKKKNEFKDFCAHSQDNLSPKEPGLYKSKVLHALLIQLRQFICPRFLVTLWLTEHTSGRELFFQSVLDLRKFLPLIVFLLSGLGAFLVKHGFFLLRLSRKKMQLEVSSEPPYGPKFYGVWPCWSVRFLLDTLLPLHVTV